MKQYESYGFLGPEINRRWVLWAIRNPYAVILFLSGSQTVWLCIFPGPGYESKMGPVSYQMSLWTHMVFEWFWNTMTLYGCLGPEINRRWVFWAIRNRYELIRILSGSETIWIHGLLGPEINRRWVLSAITHPINLYGVCAILKQYDFVRLSGFGNESMMGVVSYQTPYRCIRLLNRFEPMWIHMFFGPGNKSKMVPVSYQKSSWMHMVLNGSETLCIYMVVRVRE